MRPFAVRSSLAVGLICLGLGAPALAEVSTDPLPRHRARTLLMDYTFTSITDGADPIPSVRWRPYRHLPPGRQLNKSGALRPDGRPDLVYRLPTAAPLVVWAYNNGSGEHDIAFAAWEDDSWGPIRFLTSSAHLNEIDPRVFYRPDGVIHVVWTVHPVDADHESLILLATRTPGTVGADGTVDAEPVWSNPIRISRPGEQVGPATVAESHGQLWVAYERYLELATPRPTQIVIRRRSLDEAADAYTEALVVTSSRVGKLDPLLTSMHGRLWLDWRQAPDQFGFIHLRPADMGWSPVQAVPLPNPSWLMVEDVRQTIRRRVISAGGAIVEPVDPLTSGDAAD